MAKVICSYRRECKDVTPEILAVKRKEFPEVKFLVFEAGNIKDGMKKYIEAIVEGEESDKLKLMRMVHQALEDI